MCAVVALAGAPILEFRMLVTKVIPFIGGPEANGMGSGEAKGS